MKKFLHLLMIAFIAAPIITNAQTTKKAIIQWYDHSSSESSSTAGYFAYDGDITTRWASQLQPTGPEFLTLFLKATYDIRRVKINWEAAYAKDYKIQIQNPDGTFRDIKTVTGNTSLVNDLTGLSGTTSTIRIYCTARGSNWGYSIYEVEVFGVGNVTPEVSISSPTYDQIIYNAPTNVTLSANATDADGTVAKVDFYLNGQLVGSDNTAPFSVVVPNVQASSSPYNVTAIATDNEGATGNSYQKHSFFVRGKNLALNKPVTVSSTENSSTAAAYAVDGSASTRWSSVYADPQYIFVDLQSTYLVQTVKIKWETASAKYYQIQTSLDKVNWTTVADVSNNNTLENTLSYIDRNARYVKIYGINRNTVYGYSIFELEVYGTTPSSARLNLPEIEAKSAISVYPNPSRGNTNIDFNAEDEISALAEVTVLDQHGKVREVLNKAAGSNTIAFNTNNLDRGVYLIKIKTAHQVITRRLVVNK